MTVFLIKANHLSPTFREWGSIISTALHETIGMWQNWPKLAFNKRGKELFTTIQIFFTPKSQWANVSLVRITLLSTKLNPTTTIDTKKEQTNSNEGL